MSWEEGRQELGLKKIPTQYLPTIFIYFCSEHRTLIFNFSLREKKQWQSQQRQILLFKAAAQGVLNFPRRKAFKEITVYFLSIHVTFLLLFCFNGTSTQMDSSVTSPCRITKTQQVLWEKKKKNQTTQQVLWESYYLFCNL